MTRPSPYTSYLGNYNGDVPPNTTSFRPAVANPELVLPSDNARPTLTAYRGYDGGGVPNYYFDGADWRDTLTDDLWENPAESPLVREFARNWAERMKP